ncbi:NAD kinase [Polluticaenibacter yanchengensis]|uniref:NAD kinase n=1 Tax=Polluticaenibacter yanchengensis TaxID=3014562 RepID=A0ABT4UJR7_9BACT|nr:NAD kinase [Chitinophagaceae bacterium LY-5]
MKVAIYSRGLEEGHEQNFYYLLEELAANKIEVLLYSSLLSGVMSLTANKFDTKVFYSSKALDETVDFVISLGGDGTVLDCACLIKDKKIPLVGINFGRLGFLANIGKEQIRLAIKALVEGEFTIDQRSLIHVDGSDPIFSDAPFGLNELVIYKQDGVSTIKVHTYINGEFLNTYWCDGLIVSTPTGSTGYNLSCNGPILFPENSCFVITPIAPHHLNVRPLVVADSNVISFEIETRSSHYVCSVDTRREVISKHVHVAVRKEDFTIGLIRFNDNTFLETLRNKLGWGVDKRN